MNGKLFSDAMDEIDDKYIMEALAARSVKPLHSGWRKLRSAAACFCAVILIAVFSFGTAFAVNTDFRQTVTSFLFPVYTENRLHEIDEGHRTGSFSMEDTLFTFLEKFNRENLAGNITVKKDHGYEYEVLSNTETSADVIVECTNPDAKLLVVMERSGYKETTGLWQITAYQVLDNETAKEMIDHKQ